MVTKKMFNIVYRFSYIKQQIERGFTRAYNALITRSRFRSNSFTLSFIVSCLYSISKEYAKEQILDELCIMPQVILFATDRNENLKRDRKW